RDVGQIAVLEDDGTFFYPNANGQQQLDVSAVARAFYRTHPDSADFLAVYLASGLDQWLGSPGALAAEWMVRNDVQGIGLDLFDAGAALGVPPRLESVLTMNGLHRYPADPDAPIGGPGDTFSTMDVLAHEFAHQWLAYVLVDSAGTPVPALLGRDLQHWNFFFDSDSSYMEGCDWAEVAPDSFLTDGVSATFGALDRYLMGLTPKAAMDSFFVVNAPVNFTPPGTYVPWSSPFTGLGCDGRADWWTVDDIERVHGPRVPDAAAAPRAFRVAFALVVPRDSDATAADLAKLDTVRTRFPGTIAASTAGGMSVDVSLPSQPGELGLAATPLHDTEDAADPRPVGVRAFVAGTGRATAVDPASVTLHWRASPTAAFAALPMGAAGPDSFAASLPPEPAGTRVQYWLSAASTPPGLVATQPAAGPLAPYAYAVGPDLTPPVVRHVPVPVQSVDRLPVPLLARVTDNLGVDSVWVEYRIGAGPPQTAAAAPAGDDSFTVAIGAGAARGARIAYRFVARDAAAAGNLGYSNPAFDTLVVDHDWLDGFENPTPWFHQPYKWSYRDAWALEDGIASPAGGTAWHCGGDGPYPPHLDAVLVSTPIYGIGPGATLTFDHRWSLEASGTNAYDGARVEVLPYGGTWQIATPAGGYTHAEAQMYLPFALGSPCWSGEHPDWRTETVDLSPFGPGPIRIRFRMMSDDFLGDGGWWVDRVHVHFPDETLLGAAPPAPALALGAPWPNPARASLAQTLTLPARAAVEWTLHDVAGRRIAVLWRGPLGPGPHALAAALPRALPAGVYFTRLSVDGRRVGTSRLAVLR
ncbi:MAG TPA: hypothetical protein VGU27_04850, partial [Candidatus Eisenbacteria bacterium]|nr:hypothetical protein [Candidatus Eisenbacteria bacterium]